jgi:hypothetical protein
MGFPFIWLIGWLDGAGGITVVVGLLGLLATEDFFEGSEIGVVGVGFAEFEAEGIIEIKSIKLFEKGAVCAGVSMESEATDLAVFEVVESVRTK